jgi:uncharacterized ParB-like nuclease family protein
MQPKPLSIDLIKLDGDTQSRLEINKDTVEDYAEILSAAQSGEWPFPPLDVFHDGKEYFAADGFHRCLGAKKAGRSSVPCVIHEGTAKDARIFGMTANDRNGLRMTRLEKRSNVEWLLDNGGKMPRKDIATSAGVSVRTVDSIISDRKPKLQIAVSPPQSDRKRAGLQPADGEPEAHNAHTDAHTAHTTKPDKPPKLEKKYDRSFWYKQWNASIGPLCRLVEKIAEGVGERQGARHKNVKANLEAATQQMIDWMEVKR